MKDGRNQRQGRGRNYSGAKALQGSRSNKNMSG